MTTIIRRSASMGDPVLPRIPFSEPGIAPISRLSSLSYSGAGGELVTTVTDAEGAGSWGRGVGVAPPYEILSSGVPVYEFDMATSGGDPVMHLGGSGRVVKTQIFVGRMIRLGTETVGATQYSHLMRMSNSGYGGLYVGNVGAGDTGKLVAGGATAAEKIVGPGVEIGANSALHFFAGVWDGASSRLHYDNISVSGTLNAPANPICTLGYNKNGSLFQCVEAAQYSAALTPAQIEEKRAHYRALYQF